VQQGVHHEAAVQLHAVGAFQVTNAMAGLGGPNLEMVARDGVLFDAQIVVRRRTDANAIPVD